MVTLYRKLGLGEGSLNDVYLCLFKFKVGEMAHQMVHARQPEFDPKKLHKDGRRELTAELTSDLHIHTRKDNFQQVKSLHVYPY